MIFLKFVFPLHLLDFLIREKYFLCHKILKSYIRVKLFVFTIIESFNKIYFNFDSMRNFIWGKKILALML